MPKVEVVPGMSPAARKAFYVAHQQEMLDRQFARRMIALWEAVRDFLHQDAEVSGRVVIKELDRKRLVVVRGVKPVRAQWQVPAMVIDATLPAADAASVLPTGGSRGAGRGRSACCLPPKAFHLA